MERKNENSPKPGPSDRSKRAKRELIPSHSTQTLRNKIREKFVERLRSSRSQSVDHFRQFVEVAEYMSVTELRDIISGAPEAKYLLNDAEINNIMEDIEMELCRADLEKAATKHGQVSAMETEDIIDRHSHTCLVCGERTIEVTVCVLCSSNITGEFDK